MIMAKKFDELSKQELAEIRGELYEPDSFEPAGYDTTASAMGWICAHLADGSSHRDAIRTEVNAVGGPDAVTIDVLPKLTYTASFVKEILRVHPPAIWSGRTVTDTFEIHGHTIPAGEKILFAPHVTHRLQSQFPEPNAIKPGRWIDGHPDHHEAHPYAYIPFGGGPQRCLGFAFATQELIAMTAIFASRLYAQSERKLSTIQGFIDLLTK